MKNSCSIQRKRRAMRRHRIRAAPVKQGENRIIESLRNRVGGKVPQPNLKVTLQPVAADDDEYAG